MLFSSSPAAVAGLIVLLSCSAIAQSGQSSVPPPLATIVNRVEQVQTQLRPGTAYEVVRDYQLSGANSAKPDADVVVALQYQPPTSKEYEIQSNSGSGRGVKIVRRILDHEVEQAKSVQSPNAITTANYEFAFLGETVVEGRPCYRLRLVPKRHETDLVAGEALVDKHTFVIRQIEGELAKSPSWWVKDVHVKISFADIGGAWLQTNVDAVANVRFLGPQKLTAQTLDYRSADVVASNAGFWRRGSSGGQHFKTQKSGNR